jgi:hypothetical protein
VHENGRANNVLSTDYRSLSGVLAVIALALIPGFLFRDHVLGIRTYFGNPDRLNNDLKILKHYVDSIEAGGLAAWNSLEMLGYNTFALPYTFPNPLAYLIHFFGVDNFYVTAGFVSIVLLACAGIAAYFAVRAFVEDRTAAFLGAIVYQLSALSLLKVSQNDMSFAVFIAIPLGVLAIRRLDGKAPLGSYVALSLLIGAMLHFMFLQKVAYAIMLLGAYAVYRSFAQRSYIPFATFGAGLATGVTLALPRLGELAIAMSQYVRKAPGQDLSRFRSVYEFQNIRPYEILRWFEGSILGANQAEAAVHNGVNLSEGFLLYAGCAATIAAIAVLIRYKHHWFGLFRAGAPGDTRFFIAVFAFSVAIVEIKPVLWLVYQLFMRLDFTHARILIVALLPFAVLVALAVERLRAPIVGAHPLLPRMAIFLAAIFSSLLLADLLFQGSAQWEGFTRIVIKPNIKLRHAAIAHFVLTLLLCLALWVLARQLPQGSRRKTFISNALVFLIGAQAWVFANNEINGSTVQTQSVPFAGGNFYSAPRSDFTPPSQEELGALQGRLETREYRSALICDQKSAGGMCAAHVSNFWKIRLVDGYYGLGVPARIASLPWPTGFNLRSIQFDNQNEIPWRLLGLLNVRQAVVVDQRLYANTSGPQGNARDTVSLEGLRILENPFPVAPRAFFASSVEGVSSTEEAAKKLLESTSTPATRSYAEGFVSGTFLAEDSAIRMSEGGDWLKADFAPSRSPRFLVFNELYYPGWQATVGGRTAGIFPTNAVMRGVLVPPEANSVLLQFTPFSRSKIGQCLYLLGCLVFFLGAWLVRRVSARERERLDHGL